MQSLSWDACNCILKHPCLAMGTCCWGLLSHSLFCHRYFQTSPAHKAEPDLGWTGQAQTQRKTPEIKTGLTQDFCFLLVPTNLHGLSASASAARSTPARHSPGKASQEERGIFVDPEGKISLGCLMGCPGGSRQSRASYLCIDECHQTRSFRKALDLGLKTSTEGNS